MSGTASRRSAPRRSSHTHPVTPIDKSSARYVLELARAAGETMRDAAGQGRAKLGEDGGEVLVGVALVQEHGLGARRGDFELRDEGLALRRAG